mgnify:CR=1 FL=1
MKIFLKDPDATAHFGIEISKLISGSKNKVIELIKSIYIFLPVDFSFGP